MAVMVVLEVVVAVDFDTSTICQLLLVMYIL